jgi:hypothetical protein
MSPNITSPSVNTSACAERESLRPRRVALFQGTIFEIPRIGSRQPVCVKLLSRILNRQVVDDAIISTQYPIRLSDFSEPQPDVAVLKFRQDYYREGHLGPGDVLLVIEVAETAVSYDRNVKMPLYARAGIPEALLFNLPDDRLEYFSEPEMGVYQVNRILNRGERFESKSVPGLTLDVEIILG